jgi:hypothetical protein
MRYYYLFYRNKYRIAQTPNLKYFLVHWKTIVLYIWTTYKFRDNLITKLLRINLKEIKMQTPNGLEYVVNDDPAGFWEVFCNKSDGTGSRRIIFYKSDFYITDPPDGDVIDLKMTEEDSIEAYNLAIENKATSDAQLEVMTKNILVAKYGSKWENYLDSVIVTNV